MNKKVLFILLALCLLIAGCAKQPEAPLEEAAVITVKIVAESQNIDESFEIETTDATLADVLKNNAELLGAEVVESTYGAYVTGMGGYTADETCEFFALKVNGEDSMVGASEVEIKPGDVYTFELSGF